MEVRTQITPLELRSWRRLPWLTVLGLSVVAFHVLAFGLWAPGSDARIYYVADLDNLYRGSIFTDTFNYSPAFAWWIQPIQHLPFAAFMTIIAAANLGSLVFLIGAPLTAVVLLAQVPPVWAEVQQGNLDFLTAALIVVAIRRPAWWGPIILSKVTPGVGVVWHAMRREWRSLAIAFAATVASPSRASSSTSMPGSRLGAVSLSTQLWMARSAHR